MNENDKLLNILREIQNLTRFQLIIDLYKIGLNQGQIAKKLHMAKKDINTLLKGIDKKVIQG